MVSADHDTHRSPRLGYLVFGGCDDRLSRKAEFPL
jgi:hypothetical protein